MKFLKTETFIQLTIFLLLAVVCLAYDPSVIRIYDLPKALILKIGAIIISIAWITMNLVKKRFCFIKSSLFSNTVFAIALTALISSFLSEVPQISLIGLYEGQIGSLGLISALVIALIFYNDKAVYFINFLAYLGFTLSVIGLLLYFDINPLEIQTHPFTSALSGNPNFFANFICITTLCSFHLAITSLKRARVFNSVILFTQTFALITSNSRGAWISFAVAAFIYLIHYSIRNKKPVVLYYLTPFACILLSPIFLFWPLLSVLFSLLLIGTMLKFRAHKLIVAIILSSTLLSAIIHHLIIQNNNLYKQEQLQTRTARFYSIYKLNDKATPRYALWSDSLTSIKEIPVWGLGLEQYRRHFLKFKSQRLAKLQATVSFSNPHNNYIYHLISFGPIGFILYYSLLILALVHSLKRSNSFWPSILTAFLFIYIPSSDTNEFLLLFWLIISAFYQEHLQGKQKSSPYSTMFFILLVAILAFNSITLVNNYQADKKSQQAMALLENKEVKLAAKKIQEAINLNPNEELYLWQESRLYFEVLSRESDENKRKIFTKEVLDNFRKSKKISWMPERTYDLIIRTYLVNKNRKMALKIADEAIEICPHCHFQELKNKIINQ